MKKPRSAAQLANDARLAQRAKEPRIPLNAKPITARSRQPRAETVATERRRRRGGTLNRMHQFKLDVFSPDQLDPDRVYRWIADDGSRLRGAYNDDYDYVGASEIKNFDAATETDSEGGERVRMLTGKDKWGNPEYSYLMAKPRQFWEDDNRAAQDYRDDVLEGRVYRGEGEAAAQVVTDGKLSSVAPEQGADTSQTYVPAEARLEHGLSGRRRGPVSAST